MIRNTAYIVACVRTAGIIITNFNQLYITIIIIIYV